MRRNGGGEGGKRCAKAMMSKAEEAVSKGYSKMHWKQSFRLPDGGEEGETAAGSGRNVMYD
jgi:hypothetical protein